MKREVSFELYAQTVLAFLMKPEHAESKLAHVIYQAELFLRQLEESYARFALPTGEQIGQFYYFDADPE
jgi:hypothetical protein